MGGGVRVGGGGRGGGRGWGRGGGKVVGNHGYAIKQRSSHSGKKEEIMEEKGIKKLRNMVGRDNKSSHCMGEMEYKF